MIPDHFGLKLCKFERNRNKNRKPQNLETYMQTS